MSKTIRDKLNLEDSEEEEDPVDFHEDSRFLEYLGKKQQVIPKEFAFAIIEKMREGQGLDLYERAHLLDFKS